MTANALLCLAACACPLFAALPSQDFRARLLTPLSSYSVPGTEFQAKLLGPVSTPQGWTLPAGTTVHGIVRAAKSVGLGIKRERASLELEFRGCESANGSRVACGVRLTSVDNARESVRDNRIDGILAAAHPHSWLSGIWYRPTIGFLRRSPAGLTGVGGMAQARLLPTPAGAALVIASRLALVRLPDPEILLPVGTDLILHINPSSHSIPVMQLTEESSWGAEMTNWAADAPFRVTRPDGMNAGDIVNIAFSGTEEQVISAFAAAGWARADALSAKTFARTYAAAAAMKTYRTAPVSPLYYEQILPGLVFQKSFNSLAKRHHIRLWRVESPQGPLWLGAATHDIAVNFDWNRMIMTHRIDSEIDKERDHVASELAEAGCIQEVNLVERPRISQMQEVRVHTDGMLFTGSVTDCQPAQAPSPAMDGPASKLSVRLARQAVLETRQYFVRGNIYYWTYQAIRDLSSRVKGAKRTARLKRSDAAAALKKSASDDVEANSINPEAF